MNKDNKLLRFKKDNILAIDHKSIHYKHFAPPGGDVCRTCTLNYGNDIQMDVKYFMKTKCLDPT